MKIYNKIKKVVIVGGGSAGWMTATHFSNELRHKKDVSITLVESPNHPTIGVGESTIGGISHWLELNHLNHLPFLKDTDGTIKLSIRFENFYKKGDGGFHYPFGGLETSGCPNLNNDWFFKKLLYPDTHVSDFAHCYYSQMALVKHNTLTDTFPNFKYHSDKAVHFDATKFGQWLKNNVCIPNGVKHILKEVKETPLDESGGIDHLLLDDGSKIEADLFIDCTGFKSLLLGKALKEPFIDMSPLLPNNKAWATRIPYKDKKKEICSYTNCFALGNGWVWEIPLWSRWGTGYVFSDKYVSDEDALKEFKEHLKSRGYTDTENYEYKKIHMRVGRHERVWVKNVLAIGLSAGFIEPLESNGLYSVHEYLNFFFEQCESRLPDINSLDRSSINYQCGKIFDIFSRFVIMHYAMSARDDTPYWRDIASKDWAAIDPFPEGHGTNFWKSKFNQMWADGRWDLYEGMNCIATGMNFNPWGWTKERITTGIGTIRTNKDRYQATVDRIEAKVRNWELTAKKCKSTYDFIKDNWYSESESK